MLNSTIFPSPIRDSSYEIGDSRFFIILFKSHLTFILFLIYLVIFDSSIGLFF